MSTVSSLLLQGSVLLLLASTLNAGAMTNSWAVQIQSGGKKAAAALASKYGFANKGKVRRKLKI